MAGLIKKQILKHLSRFAKNLSPDKINLSTLKGEGQLTNLELDEEVLQSLLDLPTWLAINHVGCNKAAIRIPWTKLKTHPICLTLDKVVMEMSTCDEPRPPNGPSPLATASGQSEYGFAEKVVEGMSLSINSIVIRISAKAFNASFELSQLQVYSVNPSWSISDLRFTRIQDPQRGEILSFKEISWQMIRIEADAIQSAEHEVISAPIRLITNQSKIRVTLKRRIKDCNVVASKLLLILDDLLWVLTDSQLKAMVQYAKSLSEAMEKSNQQRKSMATEDQVSSFTPPSAQQVRTQQASSAADPSATMAKLFSDFDVCETSHHLQIKHLDLHICDDIHAKDKAINKRVTGGAMQLSFSSITLDYYPFHKAGASCLHWMHYGEATKARESWARNLLEEFKSNVDMLKSAVRDQKSSSAHSSPQHGKINTSSSFSPPPPQTPKSQLMSSSLVLRMADFSIYQVSTADQRRSSPKAMISCNKKSLYLPPEMPAIHVEFTEYYFPDGKDYPIPCPNLFAQLNALQLVLDPRSLVWLNLFALDLRQNLEQFMEIYKLNDSQKPDEHVDIKVDGLMLKLVIPTDKDPSYPADLPHSISVQTSEMVATNTRHPTNCTRSCLEALLQAFQEQDFFSSSILAFPHTPSSLPLLHPVFHRHAHEQDTRLHDIYKGLVVPTIATDSLKMPAASDFWALHFAQFWVDYEGKGRPQPFVDSFPLTIWACQPAKLVQHQNRRKDANESGLYRSTSADSDGRLQRKRLLKEYYSSDGAPAPSPTVSLPPTNGLHKPLSLDSLSSSSKEANLHVLVHVHKPLSAQVSHQQYVFLMQLQRSIKALQQTLQQDLEEISSKKDRKDNCPAADQQPFTACLGLLLQSAEVSLLLKPVPHAEGSPLVSELSPSESRGTLDPAREPADGADKVPEETGAGSESGVTKGPCTVDQLLCGEILEDEVAQGRTPLIPTSSTTCSDTNHKVSLDERSSAKNSGKWSLEEEVKPLGESGLPKSQNCDPPCDSLGGKDSNDKTAAGKMPQSVSSGRLMRDRSQSNFSVSYKNMKKSPSLQSLDNISIDSCMEDGDPYNLLERDDVSISGFKDVISEHSATESAMDNAAEVVMCQDQDGGASPDTVSATSQSIDEPTKDIVSVLMLKVQSVCVGMEAIGESTAVALEVGRVMSNQLGNISLRQYLSNRSLGMVNSVSIPAQSQGGDVLSGVRSFHGPEVCARLESGASAAVHSELAKRNGFLTLCLQGYQANFLMSTLRNMAHFLEDYSAPQVLPMEISVMDTHINLKDDDPSEGPPNSEPSPITLHVDSLIIHRKDDGSFTIGVDTAAQDKTKRERQLTDTCLTPVPEAVGNICGISKTTQTPAPPSSPQPSSREKMLIDENECLKVELSRAKMALAEAQMEKDSLLHRLKSLKVSPS
ncbi:UHRF1-binding protein 1-like isoform X1 [Boleophthalmus pectinirostris]|uniref:UHRF1-binding protein 1-like isoform X1 n=1 Tax=Boleophthalmus pectinirostris TaxID=150288 RepID=UPI000A1C206D|nr:UHRF1-binding protein 1-like isoform X1 [Boleophthalmus pectinirostris]